jgi:uncharacterized metal-binding protein
VKPRKKKEKAFDYRPLTDNFKANMLFMGLGLLVVVLLWFTQSLYFRSINVTYLLWVTGGYFLGSYWFSPDLDHIENRPGKHSFPIKFLVKFLKAIRTSGGRVGAVIFTLPLLIAEVVHTTLNVIWRMIWQPFASLVTHRGIIHIPVIGTLLKWYWVGLVLNLVERPLSPLLLKYHVRSDTLDYIISLLPLSLSDFVVGRSSMFGSLFTSGFTSPGAMFAFGLLFADLTHILVDHWDSRGRSFLPPPNIAPRGIISRVFSALSVYSKF